MSFNPSFEELTKEAKLFVDANVWDGEDRSGSNDMVKFSPDALQELIDDLLEHLSDKHYI